MKIAFFLDISCGLGGAGNLLLQQAVLMSELHKVIVVIPVNKTGNYSNEYVSRCERHGVSYRFIKYSTAYTFSLIDFATVIESAVDIEKLTREEDINFFHSVQLNIAAEFVSRKLGIPHLMNIYQLSQEDFKICPGDIYSHHHLCDSFLYSDRWRCHLGIESKCIRPVAPLNSIREKNIYVSEKLVILMLGNVCVRKNQMEAIKAIEQCIDFTEIELHIAGDEDRHYGEECRNYVSDHGLEKVITFHGFVSNIEPLLEKCDCFLCSSIDESFPSSIVEAMTYDLTIISTPVAGVPELLFDEENSFISKGYSYKDIGKSIRKCAEFYRNGKIVNIHKNAKNTWMQNFERGVVRNGIDSFYKNIKDREVSTNLEPFFKAERDVESINYLLRDIDVLGEEWVIERSLYYTVVKERLRKGNIYIWGAGKRGKLTFQILKRICPEAEIIAFIDTYKAGNCYSIPIIKPEDISFNKKDFYCVSFAVNSDKVKLFLEENDMALNGQIWIMP